MTRADTSAVAPVLSGIIAGVSLSDWAYAARVWVAMVLALLASFWLQLDSASSSAVTVAILAQPRRGDALRKAVIRLVATVVGVAASIAITALFSQSRDLFIVAFAAWMGLAVCCSKFYDNSRAYGFVLAGYTVSLIAVTDIDAPQAVFMSGMSRLAVLTVGIASIALVNDILGAPVIHAGLGMRLRRVLESTTKMTNSLACGEARDPSEIVDLLATIGAMRNDVYAASAEVGFGRARAAAAASAMVAMIEAINQASTLPILSRGRDGSETDDWRRAVRDGDTRSIKRSVDEAMADHRLSIDAVALLVLASHVTASLHRAARELDAMESDAAPSRRVAMPIHRDREVAWLAGLRVFIGIILSSILLVQSNWPTASVSLGLIGLIAGLSAQTPNPAAFGKAILIALAAAYVIAGVTEYLVLDGADAFPLLALGLAPGIFLSCLLSLKPKTSAIGSLTLVFILVFFAPSNPQNYSAEAYVYTGALSAAGACLFVLFTAALIPVTDRDRRRWMLKRVRRDLLDAKDDRPAFSPEETAFVAADRLVALSRFRLGAQSVRTRRLSYVSLLSNLTLPVGRAHRELYFLLREGADARIVAAAKTALTTLDASALRASGEDLRKASSGVNGVAGRDRYAAIVSDLAIAATLLECRPATWRHLKLVAKP